MDLSLLPAFQERQPFSDFPSSGKTATLQWSQAKQSFVVTDITEIVNSAADLSSLQGTYSITDNHTATGSSCASLDETNGTDTSTANVTTSGNTVTIIFDAGTPDACTVNLGYYSGNSASGFNLSGPVSCVSDNFSVNVNAIGLRKINNQLHGQFITPLQGCLLTDTF